MVTRPQASEPAVAAIAPTVATEPLCTAKTLAEKSGAATEQPSDQATAPTRTAMLANQPGAAKTQPNMQATEPLYTYSPADSPLVPGFEHQIFMYMIARPEEAPSGADVEKLARDYACELAPLLVTMPGEVTELIEFHVASFWRATAIFHRITADAQGEFGALPLSHEPLSAEEPVPLVRMLLTVASGHVTVQVASALNMSATGMQPEPNRYVEVVPPADAGVERGRPPGDMWAACDRCVGKAGVLMMLGMPTIAEGGSGDNPDLLRIAAVMNEANLPSADLIVLMPQGVTYDEYIEYVMRLTNDQITELVEEGGDTVHGSEMWCGDEPFAVHIILVASNIDEEMRVDDVFDLMPDDTTPANFARACVLMGETMRTALLTQRG